MPVITTNELQFLNMINYPDIEIQAHAMTFITGKSGCGKSSLLKLICGVINPSKGSVIFHGENIYNMNPDILRNRILLAAQEIWLFNGSIYDNFKQFYDHKDLECPDVSQIKDYLHVCLADFDLNSQCETLSGGEKHRVFLAICLSFLPEVILMDEPTSALDDQTSKHFFKNLKKFCKEKNITVIVVCHNKELAGEFGDFILEL